jgi:hypothetical protein
MKFVKYFENFKEGENGDDILHIFDFDDTIVKSPRFEELVIKSDRGVNDLLDKSLQLIGVDKSELKFQGSKVYIEDPERRIKEVKNWIRRGDKVYLTAPDVFYKKEISFSTKLTNYSDLYKSVDNKAIITAREDTLKSLVKKYLKKLDLGLPKFGLFMYPLGSREKVHIWKAKEAIKLIKKTGFKRVRFYDDKTKNVNHVVKWTKAEFGDGFDIIGIKV